MGTPAPPHELFEDGPRAGAVYKAGFAALTAPDVMADAAGGPVARELPPFRPAPGRKSFRGCGGTPPTGTMRTIESYICKYMTRRLIY